MGRCDPAAQQHVEARDGDGFSGQLDDGQVDGLAVEHEGHPGQDRVDGDHGHDTDDTVSDVRVELVER